MNVLKSIVPAIAGSLVLNFIHEVGKKRVQGAPEINKIGEDAIAKAYKKMDEKPPQEAKRYAMAMAGDLLANTVYYRMVGGRSRAETWIKGLLYGVMAGVGVLTATKPLGLDDTPVNRNARTKGLTVLYYTLGGLATAAAYIALNKDIRN